jgi:hypothetical protein
VLCWVVGPAPTASFTRGGGEEGCWSSHRIDLVVECCELHRHSISYDDSACAKSLGRRRRKSGGVGCQPDPRGSIRWHRAAEVSYVVLPGYSGDQRAAQLAIEEVLVTSIRRQISISRATSEVFGVLADVDRLAEFSHMTVGVSNGPGRALAVGDHFNQVVKVLHVELDTEWEVTQVIVGETIRVEGRSKANGSASVTQHVAAQGDGSLVTFEIEYDPPFGILGDIADRVVFEKRHEQDAEQILVGLKTLCEGATVR